MTYLFSRHVIKSMDLSPEKKRALMVSSRNVVFALTTVILLFGVWLTELKSIAFSVAALGAAIIVAFKETIMSITGTIYITAYRLFSVGDVIEIASFRGEVIDKTAMSVILMEIGSGNLSTGKRISIPSSLFLINSVKNESFAGKYGTGLIELHLSPDCDFLAIEEDLQLAMEHACRDYLDDAIEYIRFVERSTSVDLPGGRPRVIIKPVNEKLTTWYGRFPVPYKGRLKTEQAVIRNFYINQSKRKKAD